VKKSLSLGLNFLTESFRPNALEEKILFIAMDTEYQSNYTANVNLCLSYQYAAYSLFDGKYKSGIFYPDINEQQRYTIGEFTHKVLDAMGLPIKMLKDWTIIYISHFFTAEWAMFKDRKELYMKFDYIRKTMITGRYPLRTTILDNDGNKIELSSYFRDTMLLLPDGYKSLEKASTFIDGYEKVDIGENKAQMYQFMVDNPELFEKYAIRDAEVTLRLFIKLQYMLNTINGSKGKLFSTLASATTNDFKQFSKKKFGDSIHDMQYDRLHDLYKRYESIADRSYLGGLNSSYHIGVSEGYTFIDIDFKNAYPTAMNLLKVGNFGINIEKIIENKQKISLEGLDND